MSDTDSDSISISIIRASDVIGESSIDTEDEDSFIQTRTKKKKQPLRIESEDSESEDDCENFESDESAEEDENDHLSIENENEVRNSPFEQKVEVKDKNLRNEQASYEKIESVESAEEDENEQLQIESDDSDSEGEKKHSKLEVKNEGLRKKKNSSGKIEYKESEEEDENDQLQIESDDSENEVEKLQFTPRVKAEDKNLRTEENFMQGRPSMWEDNNVLSSTRIERFSNQLHTPKHVQNRNLKESFLTPREVKRMSSESDDDSDTEIISKKLSITSKASDIIEVSSDEEEPPPTPLKPKLDGTVRQTTLESFIKPSKDKLPTPPVVEPTKNYVTQVEYDAQSERVGRLEEDLARANNVLRSVNLSGLPDNGQLLLQRHDKLNKELREEKIKLGKMVVRPVESSNPLSKEKILSTWDDMQKATDMVLPRTQGKQAMATLNAEKALTLDLLAQLHSSLKTCPDENTFADDPKGLKVELMPHQKRALAWLMFRESQKPAGGILADDMGLGKTLTMISLVMKQREIGGDANDEENDEPIARSGKYRGGTLVVCPASLVNQWEGEILRRTRRGLLDIELYHGPKRERKPKRLAAHNIVITTYSIVQNEYEKNGAVFGVKWHRIILDEAHQIRNYKSRTAMAVCALSARKRWTLTGTPVHNKEEDMYALLKFLRCTPFDDLAVWRRWISNKNSGGQNRLSAVMSSLLLRRTKADLLAAGSLKCLPERKWQLITINLDKQEMDIYHKVLVFSRTLFAQFLHQRAEKMDSRALTFNSAESNPEYMKMHQKLVKLNRYKEIKQHHILVLLLRLRQICCHPCLITSMLENSGLDEGDDDNSEEVEELNILEQLSRLDLEDDRYDPAVGLSEAPVGLAEASRGILNPSHPVFSTERRSSKIKMVLQVLKEKVLSTSDKAIIVSQWTSLLQLIAKHLKEEGVQFNELNGSIPVHKRMGLVDDFNNPNHPIKVMLLSLTAGGVGLNLIGGNHLFLVDLHWNPQLEMQAQDRIYRVGQSKDVNVYKFMTLETIEERIKKLQESKLSIADSMLTGNKIQSSKLTLPEMKMLFNM